MENKRGASFNEILTVAFVTLRLTDKIDWSWLWVLSPLWIPLLFRVTIEIIKANIKKGE